MARIAYINYIEKTCNNCGKPFTSTTESDQQLCIDCEGDKLIDKTVKIQADQIAALRSELAAAYEHLDAIIAVYADKTAGTLALCKACKAAAQWRSGGRAKG